MNVPNQFHLPDFSIDGDTSSEKRNLPESQLFVKLKLNKFKGFKDFLFFFDGFHC